jgi:hypothetical protein
MKSKQRGERINPTRRIRINPNHALVGTWEQAQNPIHVTTAVFTVSTERGRFRVTGLDESEGAAYEISNIRWDGKVLRLTSLFPPTNHKATNALRLTGEGQLDWRISHPFEGGTWVDHELWIKRNVAGKRNGGGTKTSKN